MGGSALNQGVLEGDDAPGQSPYERLSQRMLDISGDRGVLKDVIREGAGDLVAPDATVLDITLWGMELGLLSMRRGELARFLFKPAYAYGTLGCPPLIPPDTTVLFEIELLDFLDSAESDKFCALSAEQQDQFPLQKVLKVAATEREFGNYLFRQNRFCDARVRYKRVLPQCPLSPLSAPCICRGTSILGQRFSLSAIDIPPVALSPAYHLPAVCSSLSPNQGLFGSFSRKADLVIAEAIWTYRAALLLLRRRSAPPDEQHLTEAAKLLILLNLSFTYLKLDRPALALRYGEQALIIDQKNAKALFRCGQVSWKPVTWEQIPRKRW
ncbi:Inactive peptidyl-prolyl cis-trans isomerase fkbp6 [Saguinus oedipus]|uniref:peptidylprolyl isomerase n=1 Tax=Saguinus oedipus TaxID=9490 RepID=A0ABQ9W6P9_SAGOE|nr:Inactive peptidyl-prolyl cis-trans isomerase fkbp6 [Saguinus oedipus]